MEESRWGEKEVEVGRMTDKIKNKYYVGIRDVNTTGHCNSKLRLCIYLDRY